MQQLIYDTIIIGGGPAGYTAGIYACRGGLKALLLECFSPASQLVSADLIENYPGFPEGISGFQLIEKFKSQAKNLGLEFHTGSVEDIKEKEKHIFNVRTKEKDFNSLSIILAVGARPRQLDIEGEKRFLGKGVSYCAICDGAFFKGKDIVVVGGGNAAVEEALYLTRFAGKVFLIHRRDRLRADSLLAKKAAEDTKIELIFNSVIKQIYGRDRVEGVSLKNLVDGNNVNLACSGVFASIGQIPNTDFLAGLVRLDSAGYIISDEEMQTSCQGIFACGDCRVRPLRQVVTACGEGAIAAKSAIDYVDRLKGQGYDG